MLQKSTMIHEIIAGGSLPLHSFEPQGLIDLNHDYYGLLDHLEQISSLVYGFCCDQGRSFVCYAL